MPITPSYQANLDGTITDPVKYEDDKSYNEVDKFEEFLSYGDWKFTQLASDKGGFYKYNLTSSRESIILNVYLKQIGHRGRSFYEKGIQFPSGLPIKARIDDAKSLNEIFIYIGIFKHHTDDKYRLIVWNPEEWSTTGSSFNCFINVKALAKSFLWGKALDVSKNPNSVIAFDPIFLYDYLNNINENQSINKYSNFLFYCDSSSKLTPNNIKSNIIFLIGQPNTGKSYSFEEKQLFPSGTNDVDYKYRKIAVPGGPGNEFKGLQSSDLAITLDTVHRCLRLGEFLQVLMSAIVNTDIPHVIFLDDFHNQDISSLLSEYTPLFKSQQKDTIKKVSSNHKIFNQNFKDIDHFILTWNNFIEDHCKDTAKVSISNRISGEPIKLVFPSNFYLLGAANFNEKSLNIFADWEDRADITYIDPLNDFIKTPNYISVKKNEFVICSLSMNNNLKEILKSKDIFDYEKYCFGMWKIFKNKKDLIDTTDQTKTIKFFFRMIRNSLRDNNKNSLINEIGEELLKKMQKDTWFVANVKKLSGSETESDLKEILHELNIYEDEY